MLTYSPLLPCRAAQKKREVLFSLATFGAKVAVTRGAFGGYALYEYGQAKESNLPSCNLSQLDNLIFYKNMPLYVLVLNK